MWLFCPRCGAPLAPATAPARPGRSRGLADGVAFGRPRKLCRYCGFRQFHDPKVAVSALVSDGAAVLLVRRAVIPRIGFWALPAGFMDADELPEEAVAREVAEETGVTIRPLALHAIAPLAGWDAQESTQPPRRGILIVFQAEPVAGAATAVDDVSEARWFTAAEVPWDELAFESTRRFLREWAESLVTAQSSAPAGTSGKSALTGAHASPR